MKKAVSNSALVMCLVLIFYFSLCDFALKFVPADVALPLRYLPEAALYLYAFSSVGKRTEAGYFPLLWPLAACASGMALSAVINSGSLLVALEDFRLYFRFTAFAYVGWKTETTPDGILRFMTGFLALTQLELFIGFLEVLGGEPVQMFFAPALGLMTGNPELAANQVFGEQGWVFGTLQNYNNYGMFMAMSCVIALGVYTVTGARKYLVIAIACGVFVVLSFSRHSLITMTLSVLCFYALRSKISFAMRFMRAAIIAVAVIVAVVQAARIAYPELEERLATIIAPEVTTTDSLANMRLAIIVALPPRFLTSYPLLGQGPVPRWETYGDDRDLWIAPGLKGAPDLPSPFHALLGDVVWVMVLGYYGCIGLAGFFLVFARIVKTCNKYRRYSSCPETTMLAQVCISLVLTYVLSGFFSQEIFARDTIPVFWVLVGMTLSSASATGARAAS